MSIEVNHLSKKIGKNTVLDDISCRFDYGRLHMLKGHNGSGKTMLLRALAGLIHLDSGQVSIDGKVLKKDIEFPPSIGLLIDSPSFIARFTGIQNLNMLASIKSLISPQEVRRVIERVGLDPNDSRPYSKYSLGMKKRLAIACAIMENPKIVILDEPFNALDQSGVDMAKGIITSLKSDDRIIIVASHDEDELVDIEDTRIILEHGRILATSQAIPEYDNVDAQ